jgi:hypothetical protein
MVQATADDNSMVFDAFVLVDRNYLYDNNTLPLPSSRIFYQDPIVGSKL